MLLFIKLTKHEKQLAMRYAKLHTISVKAAFKKVFFEKLEDEYDLAIADDAYLEYVRDGKSSRPVSELWKEQAL